MFYMASFIKKVIKYRVLLLMLLPATLFFLVFSYLPMAGIIISFKRYNYTQGIFGSPWVGFDNFKFLFMSGDLLAVSRNTILYNLSFIIGTNSLAIAVAVMLAEIRNKIYKKLSQSIMFFPYFVSWVIVGVFVYNLFNFRYGLVNNILKGFDMAPVSFLDKPMVYVFIIIGFKLWKDVGYFSVIYLAAISAINPEEYEASQIDGANIFQRAWRITIPSLKPTIIILVLLSLGQIFRGDFNMFYQIVGDNALVYSTTDVIDTFVTRSLIKTREFGMTSAAGLIQSIICFTIITLTNTFVRKIDKDYSLY